MAYIIGISGVDGTGKTTLSKLLVRLFQERGIQSYYRHELDFVVVKFFIRVAGLLMGKGRAEGIKQNVLSGKENNRSIVSFFYYTLVWLDSFVAFITFKLRRGVVVHDRWPYDFLLQFKYRNYNNQLIWFLFKYFPRPDNLILLKASPEVAFKRKLTDPGHVDTELEFYETQGLLMDEIVKIYRYDRVISTEQLTSEESAREVLEFVIKQNPKYSR